jgi:hypothetical protein
MRSNDLSGRDHGHLAIDTRPQWRALTNHNSVRGNSSARSCVLLFVELQFSAEFGVIGTIASISQARNDRRDPNLSPQSVSAHRDANRVVFPRLAMTPARNRDEIGVTSTLLYAANCNYATRFQCFRR